MRKKKRIDYTLNHSDTERLTFRFYPRSSACHGFGDNPPKVWSDVYKVYYNYAITRQRRLSSEDEWETEIMFSAICDENSILGEIAERCLLLADGQETYEREDGERISLLDEEIYPFGMGVAWTISKHTWKDFSENERASYHFTLFDYWDKGYRFSVKQENLRDFGIYLQSCCEYMLAHGDPI